MSLKKAFDSLKEDLKSTDNNSNSDSNGNNRTTTEPLETLTEAEISSSQKSKKLSRKLGKRSDPNFKQAPAYIKESTHQRVKIALLQQKKYKDFSELVEDLLSQWLEKKESS